MKTVTKLAMLLVVLAICMPAQGEILIYAKSMKCFEVWWDGNWDVYRDVIKGFLVLEVEYDQGEIIGIDNAMQYEYGKDDEGKWSDGTEHAFEVERIVFEGKIYYVFEDLDVQLEPFDGWMIMVQGIAKDMNIGLGRDAKREVPRLLEGAGVWYYDDEDIFKRVCCLTLRLQQGWTKKSNDPEHGNQVFGWALDFVDDWLIRRRYMEEPK